jgi:hypothetical protein
LFRLLILLLVVGSLLSACGKPDYISPAEARVAAALNECSGRAESEASRDAWAQSVFKAAEHLPRIIKLRADGAAYLRARRPIERDFRARRTPDLEPVEADYRAHVKRQAL